MTDQELEAYDAMMLDRDHWKARFKKLDKELMCELRDPNGTIWDHAKNLQDERDKFKEEAIKGFKLETDVRWWQQMRPEEMRLRCGELSAQDIRNIKAVLNMILPANVQ